MEQLIELLVRLLLILFFGLGGAGMDTPVTDNPMDGQGGGGAGDTFRSYTNILGVELLVLESNPPQVHLQVYGEQPDGCDFPVQVTQRREGNTVIVEVYRELPAGIMCPMILLTYDDTIPLEGTFPPGEYTFKVNEFTVTREL